MNRREANYFIKYNDFFIYKIKNRIIFYYRLKTNKITGITERYYGSVHNICAKKIIEKIFEMKLDTI